MERRRIRVTGVVQGVGFRPFVYGAARRLVLGGFVLNDGEGVLIEAEGEARDLDELERVLGREPPPLARVDSVRSERLPARGEIGRASCRERV